MDLFQAYFSPDFMYSSRRFRDLRIYKDLYLILTRIIELVKEKAQDLDSKKVLSV